jgi:hypothetical protein
MIAAGSVAHAEIKAGKDPEADFSTFQTYAWGDGTPAVNERVQGWIVAAVDRELQERGLRPAEWDDADLHVFTHVDADSHVDLWSNYVSSPTWTIGIISADLRQTLTGMLIVEVVDPSSENPVWLARATKNFTGPAQSARPKIDKLVTKVFKKFPKR